MNISIVAIKSKYENVLGLWLKIGLFLLCLWAVYAQMEAKKWEYFLEAIHGFSLSSVLWASLCLLLTPINWGLEAWKWQILSRPIERVSFSRAYRGVLTGLSFGLVAPKTLGEYGGKALHLSVKSRGRLAGAVLVGNFSRFLPSVVLGALAGLFYFLSKPETSHIELWLAFGLFLSLSGGLIVSYLFIGKALKYLTETGAGKYFRKAFYAVGSYEPALLHGIFWIAVLRYFVFVTQFVLLLEAVGANLPVYQLYMGVALVYLLKTLAPTLNIVGDLGVREAGALYFFGLLGAQDEKVLLAGLSLWVVNLLAPSLAGALLIFRSRMFGKKQTGERR